MANRNYNVECNGVTIVTTVTNSSSLIDSVLNEFLSKRIISLRIKWNSSSANKKVATLNLCHEKRCIIIQLLHLDSIPNSLRNLLSDKSINFVGVRSQDIAKLDQDHGLKCWSAHEIGSFTVLHAILQHFYGDAAAGRRQIPGPSVEEVISMLNHQSDWSAEILTSEQIKVATIDAYTSFGIGNMLFP